MTVTPPDNTAWREAALATNGPGAGGFDFAIKAQVGDTLAYDLLALIGNENVNLYFDVATIVSAAVVNWFGGTGSTSDTGVAGWRSEASVLAHPGGRA